MLVHLREDLGERPPRAAHVVGRGNAVVEEIERSERDPASLLQVSALQLQPRALDLDGADVWALRLLREDPLGHVEMVSCGLRISAVEQRRGAGLVRAGEMEAVLGHLE